MNGAVRSQLLLWEAKRWLGAQEQGGNNRGQLVEYFEREGGVPPGNPWCMCFVQYCAARAEEIYRIVGGTEPKIQMPRGAHCMTVWQGSKPEIRITSPVVGSVAIWKHAGSSAGHTGIVSEVVSGGFWTIEGNTSPGAGVKRDGDGVFQKLHPFSAQGEMQLQGFILPWGKIAGVFA